MRTQKRSEVSEIWGMLMNATQCFHESCAIRTSLPFSFDLAYGRQGDLA